MVEQTQWTRSWKCPKVQQLMRPIFVKVKCVESRVKLAKVWNLWKIVMSLLFCSVQGSLEFRIWTFKLECSKATDHVLRLFSFMLRDIHFSISSLLHTTYLIFLFPLCIELWNLSSCPFFCFDAVVPVALQDPYDILWHLYSCCLFNNGYVKMAWDKRLQSGYLDTCSSYGPKSLSLSETFKKWIFCITWITE